jgi:hypothetical protein
MTTGRMTLRQLTRDFAATEPFPTWAETTAAFVSDPVELFLIDELRRALARDGDFREPVVLDLEDREIRDGRHRVVAALLTGLPDIAWEPARASGQ